MPVTPIYAALLGLIYLFLSFRTIGHRRRAQVGIGDGGDQSLARAIRVHGNFAEYVPMTLLLMMLLEAMTGPVMALHIPGLLLLLGRCLHAFGVSDLQENLRFRVLGMLMTFSAMLILCLAIIWRYLA